MAPYRVARALFAVLFTAIGIWACDSAPDPAAPALDASAQGQPPSATGAYELVQVDMGDLGFQVIDINNAEQILLNTCCGSGQAPVQAAIWHAGTLTLLGAPGPDHRPGFDTRGFSFPGAINGAGAVTGFGSVGLETHAFIWRPGVGMEDLGTLPGGTASLGLGINLAEDVVGLAETPTGVRAFRWTATTGMVELASPLGFDASVMAAAINNARVTVGSGSSASFDTHALRWSADGTVEDLGTLGGNLSWAVGIADDGTIAGMSTTSDGSLHAFRWTQEGGMERVDHNAVASSARDASRAGIVGVVNRGTTTKDSIVSSQVLWTNPGGARVFRPPFADGEGVTVNDNGVIAGSSNASLLIWRPSRMP